MAGVERENVDVDALFVTGEYDFFISGQKVFVPCNVSLLTKFRSYIRQIALLSIMASRARSARMWAVLHTVNKVFYKLFDL